MTTPKATPTNNESDRTPNFELPHHGAITEDNWPEYQARGFVSLWNSDGSLLKVSFAQSLYGAEHVYTGDAFDEKEQRPLRHKPGVGIYSDPEGLTSYAKKQHEWESRRREREARQRGSEGGPSSN